MADSPLQPEAGSILRPKAVLFDIGDTLFPATEIATRALGDAAEWLLRRTGADPDRFVAAYRAADEQRTGPRVNHLWGLPLEIMAEACEEVGVSRSHALAVGALYRDRVRAAIEYDGELSRTFQALHDSGVRLGIVSDGTTVEQVDTLHLLGVLAFLDAVAVSEAVGVEKPDPAIFRYALDGLGVEPTGTWYVGDDITTDYEGATGLGMTPVLVGGGPPDALSVRSPSDVVELFEQAPRS